MNFFKLYIGDYQRDTAHLTVVEHGAYMLMLQHYYATEKPLPIGKALHRMLRAHDKDERDAIDSVARQFWIETEDGLVNSRANREINRAEHQRSVNREIGKRGGRPKRNETESVIESVSESEPINNPNQTPDTRHQTEIHPPTPQGGEPAGFAEFWEQYPRKTAKPAAVKAYLRAGDCLQAMLADLKRRKAGEWRGSESRFIPHPATYLNNRRWEDETPTKTIRSVKANDCPQWASDAGFADEADANSSMCFPHNAHEFRSGKRMEATT